MTRVGLSAMYGNFEVALQNPAGAFVLASSSDPLQSILRYIVHLKYHIRLLVWKVSSPAMGKYNIWAPNI